MNTMRGIVISIGNELLCGDVLNRDLSIIAVISKDYGIDINKEITVKDLIKDITSALSEINKYDIAFITGGLGPTDDDVTRKAIASFLGKELKFDSELYKKIEKRIRDWNLPKSPYHKNYAYIPEGCAYIDNPNGIAPGLLCKKEKTTIIVLPGPPRELEPTLKNAFAQLSFKPISRGIIKIYRTFGTREVELQKIISHIPGFDSIEVGYYPSIYGVRLKITYPDKITLQEMEPLIKERIGKDLYSESNEEMEVVLGKIMKGKNLTISTAESCTGGLIGDLITRVPGSSKYYIGGIIAYSNDVKVKILGCSQETLKKFGAVSEQIAAQMAEGVRKVIETDIGISTTGIAGPSGGTPHKPVGLVYIGFSDGRKTKVIRKIFKGSREEIKHQSALWALDLVRRMLV